MSDTWDDVVDTIQDYVRAKLRDRDELLEAAQVEIETLRAQLAVAVEALMAIGEPIDGITSDEEWVTAEALAALAKIRGENDPAVSGLKDAK